MITYIHDCLSFPFIALHTLYNRVFEFLGKGPVINILNKNVGPQFLRLGSVNVINGIILARGKLKDPRTILRLANPGKYLTILLLYLRKEDDIFSNRRFSEVIYMGINIENNRAEEEVFPFLEQKFSSSIRLYAMFLIEQKGKMDSNSIKTKYPRRIWFPFKSFVKKYSARILSSALIYIQEIA
ncbi:hypothetical protein ACOME3_000188 [Neoechinorhynchus agilis]